MWGFILYLDFGNLKTQKMNKIKLLLAEDELSLGMIVKESLETRNFDVFLCKDGEEAFRFFLEKEWRSFSQ